MSCHKPNKPFKLKWLCWECIRTVLGGTVFLYIMGTIVYDLFTENKALNEHLEVFAFLLGLMAYVRWTEDKGIDATKFALHSSLKPEENEILVTIRNTGEKHIYPDSLSIWKIGGESDYYRYNNIAFEMTGTGLRLEAQGGEMTFERKLSDKDDLADVLVAFQHSKRLRLVLRGSGCCILLPLTSSELKRCLGQFALFYCGEKGEVVNVAAVPSSPGLFKVQQTGRYAVRVGNGILNIRDTGEVLSRVRR
jgi:hypothetical protein